MRRRVRCSVVVDTASSPHNFGARRRLTQAPTRKPRGLLAELEIQAALLPRKRPRANLSWQTAIAAVGWTDRSPVPARQQSRQRPSRAGNGDDAEGHHPADSTQPPT
jgi:hypothetical protein